MYEFWYDYIKPKYQDKANLYYVDTDSFIVNLKTKDVSKDIAKDIETRFDTSNYETERPLPTGKNKKVIRSMKDELRGKMMTEFAELRPKTYFYLIDYGSGDKKATGTKKWVIKRRIKFEEYEKCLKSS